MATDGTKIIDGDRAHDTYWGIMDLYDRGADLDFIVNEFPIFQENNPDTFDNEIYITSCGLAYWEIGLMNSERLAYIKEIISRDACVKEWSKYSEKDGKSRKAVLKRYLSKIEKTNEKIRKRKKFRKISHLIFNENSVLTCKLSNGEYGAVTCVKVDQYRGSCDYWLVPFTYKSPIKPTLNDIKQSEILGRAIASGFSPEQIKASQPGIENIWNYLKRQQNLQFGFSVHGIEHGDLLKIKDQFEKIGELNILDGLKETGSLAYEDSYEGFNEILLRLNEQIKAFGYQKYPVAIVVDE
ncbi:MAG: hypothetical protein HEP71_26950 [Roseivirga sp.]|nr:hypothetical protein [Roseivirga sp.]